MRQLAEYIKEREGFDSIVTDEGFATYKVMGEECYIRDIWVQKDYRKGHVATEMADEIAAIARRNGCKYLSGSVCTTANNPTASVKILLAYGFEVHSAIQNGILFRKDL